MTFEDYLQKVKQGFQQSEFIPSLHAEKFYEEKFEAKWLATKLKQFVFVSQADCISMEMMKEYSTNCFNYALNEYKGLPRGFQNGIVSYNILASNNVEDAAIAFAVSRPQKHFAAFEIPILIDLAKQEIYYYQKTPMWGAIYYKHIKEYIAHNFAF